MDSEICGLRPCLVQKEGAQARGSKCLGLNPGPWQYRQGSEGFSLLLVSVSSKSWLCMSSFPEGT